ncbi:MAG: hypothetical protein O9972_56365 [Burkholderiales bacterium]|nr:hypothetical protein [Burkholderiales bacterium]
MIAYDPDELLAKLTRIAAISANTSTTTAPGADTVDGYYYDEAAHKWVECKVAIREVLWLETGYSSNTGSPHEFGWFDRTDPDAPVVREVRCGGNDMAKLLGVVPLRNLRGVIRGRGARDSDGVLIDYWLVVEGGRTAIAVARPAGNSPFGTPLKILEVVDQFGGESAAAYNVHANVFQVEEDRLALEALERAKAAAKIVSLDTARLARQVVRAVDAATTTPDGKLGGDGDTA